VGTAVGIFILLFSGAWILDQNERMQVDSTEDIVQVENMPGLVNVKNDFQLEPVKRKSFFVKFHPREYVRIEQR